MNAYDIIARKRDGLELSSEELRHFVRGLTEGSIPDYQASAWLMAVYLRGMTPTETLNLTLAMRDSGQCIDLSDLPNGPTLDKHSTGGVGDKTTLVVVPMLAAAGIPILKMSGRGLGFSGGTVDKLESIPGFRTDLTIAEAKQQVRSIGAALVAQTGELAPADKILYGLRDVTATIESLPLIASSIMSKKLAAGAARILLDVKVGRGAFMKTFPRAEELARIMVEIGNGAGVPTSAVLTAMEAPLGYAVGNALEVQEALDTLTNRTQSDDPFRMLCVELAAHGLLTTGKSASEAEAHDQAESLLHSGLAAQKFAQIVAAQGGPDSCDAILTALPVAPVLQTIFSKQTGVITGIDAEAIGRLAMQMGAGRMAKSDIIDPAVGIVLQTSVGKKVNSGQPLAVHHLREAEVDPTEGFATALLNAFTIVAPDADRATSNPLILGTIN